MVKITSQQPTSISQTTIQTFIPFAPSHFHTFPHQQRWFAPSKQRVGSAPQSGYYEGTLGIRSASFVARIRKISIHLRYL